MTLVTPQMSLSLDGFYAGPKHTGKATDMAGWLDSPEAAAFFRITRWVTDAMAWRERQGYKGGEHNTNSEIIQETFESAGAYVMGRRMFDGGEVPWGDNPPFRAPVFVVTHRARETLVKEGGTSFTFVTDGLVSAIEQARAAANGKDVAVAGGGSLLRQVIKAGLLDELDLHICPVVVGDGMRLFDGLDLGDFEAIELAPTRVIHTPEVTHVRYKLGERSKLVLDDRGSGETWSFGAPGPGVGADGGSDALDLGAERCQFVGGAVVEPGVGHQHVHLLDIAEAREVTLADLAGVGQQHDSGAGADHRALDLGFGEVGRGQPMLC
jgi:dihydrofolate reductase